MAVSLKDVAAAAGVSIKTVSNVVNDYPFVSPETRRGCRQASPAGLPAQPVRPPPAPGRSGLIALALPEIAAPYFAELADQVVAAAERRGLTVLIDKTGGQRGHEQIAAAGIRDNLVDGTIASPLAMTAATSNAGAAPTARPARRASGPCPVDHVAIDSVGAARTATAHLTRDRPAGGRRDRHRPPTSETGRLRLHGYQEALADAGLPQDPALHGDAQWYHRADGYAAMRELLAAGPTSTPSSASTTCWRSARCARCARAGAGCRTTSRSSASTTSRNACTPLRR